MSQENVELVRSAMDAWNRRGLEGVAEFWHPDIDWHAIEGAPDDVGPILGRDAMKRYVADWIDMFEDLDNQPEEIIDAGDDRVVAVHHLSGRARGSGIETELRYAVVYTVRDGVIVRGREYMTREEALEAAGLRD